MTRQTLNSIIALLFVVSGAAGLMYQVTWFKYLSLFLGNSTYAQTVVLATFMGGLAIGATLWGRRADVSKQPLLLYAWLEAAIGLYCFLYPLILDGLKSVFIGIVRSADLPIDGNQVLVLKLLLSLLTLLVPTILMGGTLPVLVRFISERIEDAGRNVAVLYFLNSFGAVVGSLISGFIFVPLVGLRVTIYSAAAVNVLVGLTALLLVRAMGRGLSPEVHDDSGKPPLPVDQPGQERFSAHQIRLAILIAGLSGLAAMIYEVAWVRLMIPVLGSSTYSYTLMLVAFISGITAGSWIVSNLIARLKNVFGFLAVCQLGVGLSLAMTLPLYGRIPYYFWETANLLSRHPSTYGIYLAIQFVVGLIVMIVPTIFLGMTLPVASRIAARSVKVLGRSVGNVFSINTLGTVIGSVAAGLILIPSIGVRHALEVGMAINVSLGLAVLLVDGGSARLKRVIVLGLTFIVCSGYFFFSADWNQSISLSGVFRLLVRNQEPPKTFAEFQSSSSSAGVLFYKEGTTATVAVVKRPSTDSTQNVLIINGKADASSENDLPTQVLLGQLPMLMHPHADTVMVIGYGSGVTLGSILTHPVKSVQVAEISPEVIEASEHFNHVNNRPLEDPRTRVFIDDARSILKLSESRFDVIVSEPSNPWIAGIGNLYTTEFFEVCKERLGKEGLMVQWFHLYEMDDATFELVVRTFHSVFPHVTMWQSLVADVLMIGSNSPMELDLENLRRKLSMEGIARDLKRVQVADVPTLLSLQMISEENMPEFAGKGPVNTENLPLLEYWAPKAFYANRGASRIKRFDERLLFGKSSTLLNTYLKDRKLDPGELLNIGIYHSNLMSGTDRGNPVLGFAVMEEYLRRNPTDVRVLNLTKKMGERIGRRDDAARYHQRLAELVPNDPEVLVEYGWDRFLGERLKATSVTGLSFDFYEKLFRRCIQLTGDTSFVYRARLGDLYYAMQQYGKAAKEYQRVLELQRNQGPIKGWRQDVFLFQLAWSLHALGEESRAIGYALQATMINPKHEEARDLVYAIWMQGSKPGPDTTRSH